MGDTVIPPQVVQDPLEIVRILDMKEGFPKTKFMRCKSGNSDLMKCSYDKDLRH